MRTQLIPVVDQVSLTITGEAYTDSGQLAMPTDGLPNKKKLARTKKVASIRIAHNAQGRDILDMEDCLTLTRRKVDRIDHIG